MAVLLLVLSVAMTTVAAQNVRCGSCPNVKTDDRFELTKLCKVDTWYQFERFKTAFEKDTRCNSLSFHLYDTPSTFTNTFVKKDETTQTCETGEVCFFDSKDLGKLSLKYKVKEAKVLENQTVILIKDNFFATYGCVELDCLPGYIAEFAYIYTAEREELSARELREVYTILEDLNVDSKKFEATDNRDCHECCDVHVKHVEHVVNNVHPILHRSIHKNPFFLH